MKKFIIIGLVGVLALSCGMRSRKEVTLSIKGRPLMVEIAMTKKQRERGLMFREELGWNEGMLFVFQDDEYLSFWMKNTSLPLSIAFIDKNGKVTDIFDMEPNSLTPVRSSKPCRYALEVNRNYFKELGLLLGETIDLSAVGKR